MGERFAVEPIANHPEPIRRIVGYPRSNLGKAIAIDYDRNIGDLPHRFDDARDPRPLVPSHLHLREVATRIRLRPGNSLRSAVPLPSHRHRLAAALVGGVGSDLHFQSHYL